MRRRFRPGDHAIPAAVVFEIVTQVAHLALPAGADAIELVVPIGAWAKPGVHQPETCRACVRLEPDLDDQVAILTRPIQRFTVRTSREWS